MDRQGRCLAIAGRGKWYQVFKLVLILFYLAYFHSKNSSQVPDRFTATCASFRNSLMQLMPDCNYAGFGSWNLAETVFRIFLHSAAVLPASVLPGLCVFAPTHCSPLSSFRLQTAHCGTSAQSGLLSQRIHSS